MKTKDIADLEEYVLGNVKKGTDLAGVYPTLHQIGEETFSCPVARLYLTTLATLSSTIAFREMTPEEMHEEMVRRSGEVEHITCGGSCQ